MTLNVRGLVHRLGGQKALHRTLVANGHNVSRDTVEKWCARSSIPGKWLVRLQDVADEMKLGINVHDYLKPGEDA